MTLLTLQDAGLTNLDVRFRQSPIVQLIAFVLFFCLGIGAGCWYWFGELPLARALLSGGSILVVSLLFFANFRKALSPANWILAVGPGRVLVKFRSYLNARFPAADPQVVLLDPSEIAFGRMTKQRIKAPGRRGRNETSFHTFLDLRVHSVDLTPLKERIKYERILKPQAMGRHTSAKAQHYPVSVAGADTIRIEWRSPRDIVTPGIRKALGALKGQGIAVEPPSREVIDLTEQGRRGLEKAEDKILYLAERGNLMAATRLARRAYGLGLTEARQFVEDLAE